MLRIISGSLRGRKLADSSKYKDIRPTTDRNRQALFNVITSGKFLQELDFNLVGANILDLCCGTGSFAIEAISRGSKYALCIDNNRDHLNLVQKNAENLGIKDFIGTKFIDAANLSSISDSDRYDLIFIDPPYSYEIEKIIDSLLKNDLVKENCLVVTESAKDLDFINLKKLDSRKYGITYFGFFTKLS